jgi:hypothetical protein
MIYGGNNTLEMHKNISHLAFIANWSTVRFEFGWGCGSDILLVFLSRNFYDIFVIFIGKKLRLIFSDDVLFHSPWPYK